MVSHIGGLGAPVRALGAFVELFGEGAFASLRPYGNPDSYELARVSWYNFLALMEL